jgi:LmbE family N-acetylglucosaminyl deacetylase
MARHVLIIAAHPDDELLGPGATIARHTARGDRCTIAIVADAGSARYDERTMEQVRDCARRAAGHLGVSDVRFGGFADQALETIPVISVTRWIEAVGDDVRPEWVYTHHRGDINRDHQIVSEATLTAFRPYAAPHTKRILSFETPSATEWAGPYVGHAFVPNVYHDVSGHLAAKLAAVAEYETELRPAPHPRSVEALATRAAHWGSVIGVAAAEPFVLLRDIG